MSDRSPAARAAYAELILALVDARADPATSRFDRELAGALADGRLDETTARALRWWQRESVRGVRDHLADVLPTLIEALERAAADAAGAAGAADAKWQAEEAVTAGDDLERPGGRPGAAEQANDAPPRVVNLVDRAAGSDQRRRTVVAGLVAGEPGTAARAVHGEGLR